MSSIPLQTLELEPAHTMLTPWLTRCLSAGGNGEWPKLCSPGLYIGNGLESKDGVAGPARAICLLTRNCFLGQWLDRFTKSLWKTWWGLMSLLRPSSQSLMPLWPRRGSLGKYGAHAACCAINNKVLCDKGVLPFSRICNWDMHLNVCPSKSILEILVSESLGGN